MPTPIKASGISVSHAGEAQVPYRGFGGAASPPPPSFRWQHVPISLGLLVIIVLGVAWGVDRMTTHETGLRDERARLFTSHNHDEQAHPGIRKQLVDMEKRMSGRLKIVGDDVKLLRDDIRRALSQRGRRRHR